MAAHLMPAHRGAQVKTTTTVDMGLQVLVTIHDKYQCHIGTFGTMIVISTIARFAFGSATDLITGFAISLSVGFNTTFIFEFYNVTTGFVFLLLVPH
jgi:hypothetical protein